MGEVSLLSVSCVENSKKKKEIYCGWAVRQSLLPHKQVKLGSIPESATMKIKIKPLSVNDCWRGRRFKTPHYKSYEQHVVYLLPRIKIPSGKLKLSIVWGLSSKSGDIDNPLKPFLDILQKKYVFNDKKIYKIDIEKVDVKKGEEFIEFEIESMV